MCSTLYSCRHVNLFYITVPIPDLHDPIYIDLIKTSNKVGRLVIPILSQSCFYHP